MMVCWPCSLSFCTFIDFGFMRKNIRFARRWRWQMYVTQCGFKALHIRLHEKLTGSHLKYIRIHSIMEIIVWGKYHKMCMGYPQTIDCVLELHSLDIVGTWCGYIFMFDTSILAIRPNDNREVRGHVLQQWRH